MTRQATLTQLFDCRFDCFHSFSGRDWKIAYSKLIVNLNKMRARAREREDEEKTAFKKARVCSEWIE